jgi:hypothetical protein
MSVVLSSFSKIRRRLTWVCWRRLGVYKSFDVAGVDSSPHRALQKRSWTKYRSGLTYELLLKGVENELHVSFGLSCRKPFPNELMVVLRSKCGAVKGVAWHRILVVPSSELLDNNQGGMFRFPICEMPLTERIRFDV